MRYFSTNRFLRALGLQRRRSIASIVLPSMGTFGFGLVAGAGLGLLFAPRKGSELRADIRDKLSDATHKVGDYANKLVHRGKKMSHDVSDALTELHESDTYGGNGVRPNSPAGR